MKELRIQNLRKSFALGHDWLGVAVLYLGKIVEEGQVAEVFSRPAHPYTQTLLAAVPVPDPRLRRV